MPTVRNDATRPPWAAPDRADLVQLADEHLVSVLAAMAGADTRAHPDQARAVEALVADQARVLVVQATGSKSAVYWAATSAIRALGGGRTLVVTVFCSRSITPATATAPVRLRGICSAQSTV
jgi:ATP-dependent DNA helicase RecQ